MLHLLASHRLGKLLFLLLLLFAIDVLCIRRCGYPSRGASRYYYLIKVEPLLSFPQSCKYATAWLTH